MSYFSDVLNRIIINKCDCTKECFEMFVANCETVTSVNDILSYMPPQIRRYMYNINLSDAYEIRMRLGKALTLCYPDGRYYLSRHGVLVSDASGAVKVTRANIDEALELAVKSSMYSAEEEIRDGYIAIGGGNRIGICGRGVITDGKISFLKDISGLNYRLACEVTGAADKVKSSVIADGTVKNTLIISPPGAGKTTLLRDLTRNISYGGFNVSVVDERCEIAAMHEGRPAFDMGPCTDVLSGTPKAEGMLMMLRSMAPDVIVTDEIGRESDAAAIERIINSGVKIVTTVHGSGIKQIERRTALSGAMPFFETLIVLSRRCGAGTVEEIRCKKDDFDAC